MIDLYYWPTPNGWKVTIMLEECALPYRVHEVDIGAGAQFTSEFLRICPNNRGQFLPRSGAARYRVLQWAYWQMANLGPMMGNANHFKNYAKNIEPDPAKLTYGVNRFCGEVDRLCGVMDAQLGANEWIAGSEYSIADMLCWPWAMLLDRLIDEAVWGG